MRKKKGSKGIVLAMSVIMVSMLLRMFGISNFSSAPGIGALLLPFASVTPLFTAFAWIAAGKMKRMDLTSCMTEA